MLNLTTQLIVLRCKDGMDQVIQPCGVVASIEYLDEIAGYQFGVPVVKRSIKEVHGMPEAGTACLVSPTVLAAVPGRPGVFAPDAGDSAIRDEKGQIVAYTRLVSA
ncbi:hypothetical protein [Thioalkalivibrio sp. ALE16]|uniref:hypothetical protein n=1 Tax=Thioalkalivibrio sp. ALE16 TaxID=1158172 RepID=UPI0018CAF4DF|nr:hypothetical protein [Thioalkalivibrio sp. ALE16]